MALGMKHGFYSALDAAAGGDEDGIDWGGSRGLFGGGYEPSFHNIIDYITISTPANATDFGDLTTGRSWSAACSGN